jgi:phosphotransferase system enzyme I (PtsP)
VGPAGLKFQVHEPGDRNLDGIFRLIEVAERQQSLTDVLTAMCTEVAAIAAADVASVYVREEDASGPLYTMRGNVGFPPEAIGAVHLRPGEGITGFVADKLRPASVAVGERDEHFKYIPGLGEEHFPALLAVPILRGGGAAGVLVLQRRATRAFTAEEVVLATVLATVINHALERTDERERQATRQAERGAARLRGTCLAGGAAMGRAVVLPTLAALARTGAASGAAGAATTTTAAACDETLERLAADLAKAARACGPAAARELATLSLILEDRRFRNRVAQACAAASPLKALVDLGREYARVPFRAPGSDADSAELLAERAAEVEDLCVIVYAAISGRPLVQAGAVVVAERLGGFLALHALSRGASAFVVDGEAPEGAAGVALVRAAGVPLLASVAGVFSWVHPDDLLVVDADAACVRVNPPATTVARFRKGAGSKTERG